MKFIDISEKLKKNSFQYSFTKKTYESNDLYNWSPIVPRYFNFKRNLNICLFLFI